MASPTLPFGDFAPEFRSKAIPVPAQLPSDSRVSHIWILALMPCMVTTFLAYRLYRVGEVELVRGKSLGASHDL